MDSQRKKKGWKRRLAVVLPLLAAFGLVVGLFLRTHFLGRTCIIQKGEKSIYGRLFLPWPGTGTYPLVILGHGYGGRYLDNVDYGRYLSDNGIACYAFDFCTGSEGSKSTSPAGGMSIYTEMEDMEDIVDFMLTRSWLKKDGLFLAGKSLGGSVAALVGAQRQSEVAGLILHYPFFIVFAALRGEDKPGEEEAEEEIGEETGEETEEDPRPGVVEDVFEKIREFSGPVIIFNGDKDRYVPLECSRMAQEAYDDAELVVLKGSGHGFHGEARDQVKARMVRFVKEAAGDKGLADEE